MSRFSNFAIKANFAQAAAPVARGKQVLSTADFIPADSGMGIISVNRPVSSLKANHGHYAELADQYICRDLIFAAVNMILQSIATARLRLVAYDEAGSATYLKNHPFEKMWRQPNAGMNSIDFQQAWICHMLVYGIIKCRLYYENGQPFAIVPVVPSMITPQRDPATSKTVSYVYTGINPDATSKPEYLKPNEVVVDCFYNPSFNAQGVSPTAIAIESLALDRASTEQLRAYFENSAIPSMLITVKAVNGQVPDEQELKGFKELWMQRFGAHGTGYREPAVINSDVEVKDLGARLDRLMSPEIYDLIESRVAAIFGIPPRRFLVGLRNSNQRAVAEQDDIEFFAHTIQPLLERLRMKMESILRLFPGTSEDLDSGKLALVWDLQNMYGAQALQMKRDAFIFQQWQHSLIKRDEARHKLGWDAVGGELGNAFLVQSAARTSTNGGDIYSDSQGNTTPTLNPINGNSFVKPEGDGGTGNSSTALPGIGANESVSDSN